MRTCSVVAVALTLMTAPSLAQQGPPPSFGLPAVTFGPPPPIQPAYEPAPVPDAPTPPPASDEGAHLDVGFGTEAPISVGGVITLEVPYRMLFQVGLGFMPHGYAYAIDGVLTSAGAYDESVSQVIRGSLGNSFVLRGSAGWRPFKGHGFEILGGYTLVALGGNTTAAEVINAVLSEGGASQQVPTGLSGDIPLSATLHNFHVSLGWRWLLANDRLVMRASFSYIQTVSADFGVSLANLGEAGSAVEGGVNQALNGYLSPFFTKYAKAPTLGLSAAYRF